MRRIDLSTVNWRKSSYSNPDGGQCIEVADGNPGTVPVRDSKAPQRTPLQFGTAAFTTFVQSLKDDPATS